MSARVISLLLLPVLLCMAGLAHVSQLGQASPQGEPKRAPPALKQPGPSPTPADAQQRPTDSTVIRSDVALVLVPAMVTERDGKYVPGLTLNDFEVFEDGVRQKIDRFDSVEEPFSVALMLDASGSTHFKLEEIQNAALAFVEALRPLDQVMVVSFERFIYVDSEFTSDRRQLRQAIEHTRTGGLTRLYDAVDLVITERLKKASGRKAIVLLTDGMDTASRLANSASTLDLAEEAGVLVYTIQYNTVNDYPPSRITIFDPKGRPLKSEKIPSAGPDQERDFERGQKYLQGLVETSGGRYYQAETIKDVNSSFALIAEELRHQYSLSYYPSNQVRDASYRRIRVRVDKPDIVIRTRKGYHAAGN